MRQILYKGKRAAAAILCLPLLSGCVQRVSPLRDNSGTASASEIVITTAEDENVQRVAGLGINNNVLPSIDGVTIDETAESLAPINLTVGVINSVVKDLQQRLMDLGYMDEDEPTNFYGDATSLAVKHFQRQMGIAQDGITGVGTWDALMAENAPHYALKLGFQGDDVTNVQYRLYNLGYLSTPQEVNGTYDQTTVDAVKKMQGRNGLSEDGAVGADTINLIYSDTVKANLITLGESGELVKRYQQRLIDLGYMGGTADGSFGLTTQNAIKSFQSRNNQVVDGYLGPDTRAAMDSSAAKPYAMRLGEQSPTVTELQNLLIKYGYLASGNNSGYFGEATQQAVSLFQTNNKLAADGTAGSQTMSMLRSGNVKKYVAPKSKTKSNKNSGKSGSNKSNTGGSAGKAQSGGGGGATVSGSAGNLISIASSKLGSRYVWGAKGPSQFDCSGFVYWCLNQAGVNVSYMTSAGWRNPGRFKRVGYGEIQAGDIVVVSGHVGIAAGGGTVIDASSSNGHVIHHALSGWWKSHFIAAWRIYG